MHFLDESGQSCRMPIPTTLGDSFPCVPQLDREGHAFNSFQTISQNLIVSLRSKLVNNSNAYSSGEWFQDLRSLITECVSLIDMTLHQLYWKAASSPLPGWAFKPERLGSRFGRRLQDKIGWVYQITGKPLNANEHLEAFIELKDLRNHLQHFDPPCFCYTMENVCDWLNKVHSVALLAWEMRRCMGSPLSVPLIRMLLSPVVEFAPLDPSARRIAQPHDVGYASTCLEPPDDEQRAPAFSLPRGVIRSRVDESDTAGITWQVVTYDDGATVRLTEDGGEIRIASNRGLLVDKKTGQIQFASGVPDDGAPT
jgi:hypothetical protein